MTTPKSTAPGIVFVPHTHWDREWYEPFQVFRFRLVEALDQVIQTAERDPRFRFTLDGQAAAIEDYLEIRPENTERVRALVTAGQLAIGPWLILLDEFLCSGETIVRNLQLGWASAEALGGAMRIGYLPDMFGHTAQVPQILRRAGIEHAALWRGVPGRVSEHAFRWEAPDGSSVRVEYLFDGYGNALDALLVPERIGEALREYRDRTATRWGDDPVLGMVGTDHTAPDPALMDWVSRFDSPDFPIRVATLQQYIEGITNDRHHTPEPVVVRGELRSHARGNILPGVLSIRLGLKEAMARAERTIGAAERAAAMLSHEDFTPFLTTAWRKVIESTAHDSVVGSGTDETVEQVRARLDEAAQIARAVRDGVVREAAHRVSNDAYLAVNTLARARTALLEVEVAAPRDGVPVTAQLTDGTPLRVQELETTPVVLGDEKLDAADYERVIRRIHRRELFGQDIDRYTIEPGTLTFEVAAVPETPSFDLFGLRRELAEATRQHPGTWRVLTLAQPRRRVLVEAPLPASGSATFVARQGSESAQTDAAQRATAQGNRLDNGRVDVEIDTDGTLTVHAAGTTLTGVGRIVDGGDRGDSYNYGPPASDLLVEQPLSVEIDTLEDGPLRAVQRVRRTYAWPAQLGDNVDVRSIDTRPVTVDMLVELRAGEEFVRVSVEFDNPVADHRVRFHVPLPAPVSCSASEGQFAVTERGLTGEGGWGEFPLPTYPADAFVSAGPATVLLEHATEYEVTGKGSELAITLLRAVGAMSVNVHPLRDEPAASQIPIPGAQEIGTHVSARLAIVPSAGGWAAADAPLLAEQFRAEALVQRGAAARDAGTTAPATGIHVSGRGVVVSSLRRVRGSIELRLIAMTPEPTTATITGHFGTVSESDLLGRVQGSVAAAGTTTLPLGPWEIRTVLLS